MKKQAKKNQKRGASHANMPETPKASAGMKDKEMDKKNTTTKTKETQKEGTKAAKR